MSKKIKVGSKVVIVDSGNTYTTFDRKFKELKFNNTDINREIPNGTICEVFAVTTHDGDISENLFAVQHQSGNQALVGKRGLQLVITKELNTDDKFDLLKDFCEDLELNITSDQIFKYLLRSL